MHLTFWEETFRHGHFITCTFRHVHVSALRMYRHMDISSLWTFWYKVFSARGLFDTRIFQHHGYFSTAAQVPNVCAEMSILLCKVPKYPRAENSLCQNIPMPKKSLCQNIHGDEMSMCWYVHQAESCTCRNIPVMKCPCRNVRFRNGGKPLHCGRTTEQCVVPERPIVLLALFFSIFSF